MTSAETMPEIEETPCMNLTGIQMPEIEIEIEIWMHPDVTAVIGSIEESHTH